MPNVVATGPTHPFTKGVETITLALHGTERRYLLSRPVAPDLRANFRFPVVIFLHGTGGTAAWADTETGWSALAQRERFVLVLPDGIPPNPSKAPKFLTNPSRWNDGGTELGQALHTDAADVDFLTAVIQDVIQRGIGDPRRVYLTGFSNGAGMTFRFAAERAELLTAIAPVAGYCWVRDPKPIRPVPTLYLVGTADPLIPLLGGSVRSPWGGKLVRRPSVRETLEKWAVSIGCHSQSVVVADEHGVREERYPSDAGTEFHSLFLEGHGHHWPGGRGQLTARIGGVSVNTIQANEQIWAFFKRHQL